MLAQHCGPLPQWDILSSKMCTMWLHLACLWKMPRHLSHKNWVTPCTCYFYFHILIDLYLVLIIHNSSVLPHSLMNKLVGHWLLQELSLQIHMCLIQLFMELKLLMKCWRKQWQWIKVIQWQNVLWPLLWSLWRDPLLSKSKSSRMYYGVSQR